MRGRRFCLVRVSAARLVRCSPVRWAGFLRTAHIGVTVTDPGLGDGAHADLPVPGRVRRRTSPACPCCGPARPTPTGRSCGQPRTSDSVPLALGDLVDPDPGQPIEQVVGVAAIGHHPGHDRRHGAPADPQQHREHAQCGVRGQPRAGVLERPSVFGARPRPRHVRDHHPVLGAFHPMSRGLQVCLRRPRPTPRRHTPGHRVPQREQRPACDALGRTENTSTSLVFGRFPRVVRPPTETSSTIMFWSPRPAANTLDMRNAVTPSSS